MSQTPVTIPAVRFSTEMFAPRERVAAWREFYGRGILKVDIESHCGIDFRADATVRILPNLGVLSGSTAACRHHRSKGLVDNDNVILAVGQIGETRFTLRGRETVSGAGDAVLTGGGETGFKETREHSRFICLQAPKRHLSSMVADLSDALGRRIPATTPALRLLKHYVTTLDDNEILATPDLQRGVVTHIHELIALAVGATRDAAEAAKMHGLRAARLKAIKDDIAARLDEEDLSVGAIAMRHQVTPRYVQMLFENEGVTFTGYVLDRRLARVHRRLSDPRHVGEKIAAIVFDSGFGDLSHFNRAFRRRFGMSPSDVRAQAQHRIEP